MTGGLRSSLDFPRHEARRLRFEPTGAITATDVQNAIVQAAAGGAFINVTSPPYNAVADGVAGTNAGTDNTAAFAAAVAASNAAAPSAGAPANNPGGIPIYVPAGCFYCAGGVNDGTKPVFFFGAGRAASIITVGTNNVSALTLAQQYSSASSLQILGCNSIAATAVALLVSAPSDTVLRDLIVNYGYNCISGSGDLSVEDVKAWRAYGPAVLTGNFYMKRCKIDHSDKTIWQSIPAAPYPAWAANTVTAQWAIVSLAGWLIQCNNPGGGTTGNSPPSLTGQTYRTVNTQGVGFADGTVIWNLVAPTTYRALLGTNTMDVEQSDFTGAYSDSISFAGSNVNFSIFRDCTIAPIKNGIVVDTGNGLIVEACNFNSFRDSGASGISTSGAFFGNVGISASRFQMPGGTSVGINHGAGVNLAADKNFIFGALTGISIAAGLTDFELTKNHCSGAGFAACTNAITVAAGGSDRYDIVFNKTNGCTAGVTDNGTGKKKTVGFNGDGVVPTLLVPVVSQQTSAGTPSVTPGSLNTFLMYGFAFSYTPSLTGNLLITAQIEIADPTSGNQDAVGVTYGTGTAPINGAASTGTLVGASVLESEDAASGKMLFSIFGYVTGLVVGTAYWLDFEAKIKTGTLGALAAQGAAIVIQELP